MCFAWRDRAHTRRCPRRVPMAVMTPSASLLFVQTDERRQTGSVCECEVFLCVCVCALSRSVAHPLLVCHGLCVVLGFAPRQQASVCDVPLLFALSSDGRVVIQTPSSVVPTWVKREHTCLFLCALHAWLPLPPTPSPHRCSLPPSLSLSVL